MRIFSILILTFTMLLRWGYADSYPRNYNIDVLHYRFDLSLSDSTDEIIGTASLRVLFKKKDQEEFRLDFANQNKERSGKGMVVDAVMLDGQALPYTHANDILLIVLPKRMKEMTELVFVIRYHGIPADGMRIGPNKFGERTFFSENWPNKTRHWLPCVDHPYDKATSEFIVRAPAHYQVISNGLLLEESNIDGGMRLTHWKQSIPVSCWLYVLGVADFAVQYLGQVDGKSIQTWVYAKDREAGFNDFGVTTKPVIQLFSDYIGPYVYEKIANIEATSHGGMETSSAIFYNDKLVTGKRSETIRDVVIHELAHQWFGNSVTESTWDDAWLSEGFATFFTLLFIEHAYGYDAYVNGLQKARKTIYTYSEKDTGFSVVANRSAELGAVTSAITYQKGCWFLHMLRDSIGDEKFQKGIQAYYSRYMNSNASSHDFMHEMEMASGKQLNAFFDQWLLHSQNPVITGSWKYEPAQKQVILSMEQVQKGEYVFDIPVEIGVYENGSLIPKISRFRMSSKIAQFILPVEFKPEKLVFDPRTVLLTEVDFKERK